MILGSRKWLLALCTALVVVLLGSVAFLTARRSPPAQKHVVFMQVWKAIDANYYDRTMNGLDWDAVRSNYERRLENVRHSVDLYWKVLGPMTELLESSHVQVDLPNNPNGAFGAGRAQAARSALTPESCGGLLIAFGRKDIATRVLRVDPDSFLYEAGVRSDWRMLGISDESVTGLTMSFRSRAGEVVDIAVPSADRRGIDEGLLRREFEALARLKLDSADRDTELRMDSIGISVTIGQLATMPIVVDVVNGSEAERAGIEPGSVFNEWQSKQAGGGEVLFTGKFRSPSGKPYSASFKFRLCNMPDREANMLPGNVLHLRFDAFKADVVPWLDEQLLTKPRAVILDMRRNGGGSAEAMLAILGRFLGGGTHIADIIRSNQAEAVTATRPPVVFRGPVAVLVSPLSASAAEVSASALDFHGRATLYGQATHGDVLISDSFLLADGGIVQVAVGDVRSAGGQRLENIGVKVDREILPTLESVRAGRDVVLEAALADLTKITHQ